MRSFLVVWLVAFCLVAVGASAVSWFVGSTPAPPPPAPVGQRQPLFSQEVASASVGPFSEADAVQVVGSRLPSGPPGDAARQQLQSNGVVSYHSPQHWRVCLDGACWVAHGQGRYAEAENDLARQREGPTSANP